MKVRLNLDRSFRFESFQVFNLHRSSRLTKRVWQKGHDFSGSEPFIMSKITAHIKSGHFFTDPWTLLL